MRQAHDAAEETKICTRSTAFDVAHIPFDCLWEQQPEVSVSDKCSKLESKFDLVSDHLIPKIQFKIVFNKGNWVTLVAEIRVHNVGWWLLLLFQVFS